MSGQLFMEGLFCFTDVQFLAHLMAPYNIDTIIFRFRLKINQDRQKGGN